MDANRFDALARALTVAGSRRRALALGISGMLAPLLGFERIAAHDPRNSCKKKSGKQKKKCLKRAKKHNATHAIAPPPCQNGVKDGSETDVDCGGTCPRCAIGKLCISRNDCASARCDGGTCKACADNSEAQCGLDTDGSKCGCRTHESGQMFCTKINGTPFPAGSTCAICQAGELCFPINGNAQANGLECIRPCGVA